MKSEKLHESRRWIEGGLIGVLAYLLIAVVALSTFDPSPSIAKINSLTEDCFIRPIGCSQYMENTKSVHGELLPYKLISTTINPLDLSNLLGPIGWTAHENVLYYLPGCLLSAGICAVLANDRVRRSRRLLLLIGAGAGWTAHVILSMFFLGLVFSLCCGEWGAY